MADTSGVISPTQGYGKDSDKQSNITQSGIGTSNITITDKSNPVTAEQVKTTKTTEQVLSDSGLQNRFDKDEVQSEIDLQVRVTQEFDSTRKEIKQIFNKKIEKLKQAVEQGKASQSELDNLQTASLLVDGITGALYTPNTNGLVGDVAQVAAPHLAKQIGDYFANKENTTGNQVAHGVAHAVLAAAVAAAGGNDALTAGLSAGGAELAAPVLSKWMYDTDNPDKLTAEQKQTISSIAGLIGTAAGASTGNVTDAVASGRASENAVDNNWGKEGHYSTVVAVMYLAGLPPKIAEAIGLAAWAPDTDGRNAITVGNVVGGAVADYGPQVDVHALQDKDAEWFKVERKRVSERLIPQFKDLIAHKGDTQYIANKLKAPEFQNDLHYLGDLYAHTTEDGSGFAPGMGHALTEYGGHQPDMPNAHQNAYRDYVRALHNIVSQATGQQGNVVAINRIAEDIPRQGLIIEKIESHQRGVKRTRYEVDHAKNQAKIINTKYS